MKNLSNQNLHPVPQFSRRSCAIQIAVRLQKPPRNAIILGSTTDRQTISNALRPWSLAYRVSTTNSLTKAGKLKLSLTLLLWNTQGRFSPWLTRCKATCFLQARPKFYPLASPTSNSSHRSPSRTERSFTSLPSKPYSNLALFFYQSFTDLSLKNYYSI